MKKPKKAIVLGATGLVGGILLDLLLKDDRYEKVVVFSRRKLEHTHPKLEVHIGDLFHMEGFRDNFLGDEVFCCIGSTKAKTPDLEIYKKVDYGIPLAAGKMAKENGINTFIVISAMGADSGSSLFYNKIKGEMEEAVLSVGFEKAHIVQPALIGGKRTEKRPAESFFKGILGLFDFLMIGPLKKYKIILPETIAKAMIWLANNHYQGQRIPSETLKDLASNGAS